MLWIQEMAEEIRQQYADKIAAGETIIIRDEKTLSGRVHVGSLRGIAIHGVIHEYLQAMGIKSKYIFEFNDFDPIDGLPHNVDQEKFKQYMGQPLNTAPSPEAGFKNFPDVYGTELLQIMNELGLDFEIQYASDKYNNGEYNDVIRLALENAATIRNIYKEVSGGEKPDDWYPLNVVCEKCGKIGTTKVTSFDGEKVTYHCMPNMVSWAEGCDHKGEMSPFDGNAKLPWKVEWAAKFKVYNVDVEGGGKDHSTKGGSRDIADRISREVFNYQPPYNIPYNFLVFGGKKMSSSKGNGATARNMANLMAAEKLRFLVLRKDPKQEIEFDPTGDTIPLLYDDYDRKAQLYYNEERKDVVTEMSDAAQLFHFSHAPNSNKKDTEAQRLARFSQVAFLAQMPHTDLHKQIEAIFNESAEEDTELTVTEKEEIDTREKEALFWINNYGPEDFKFKLYEDEIPFLAKFISTEQKELLAQLADKLNALQEFDGQEIHTALHDLKKESGCEPKTLFQAIYLALLNKQQGPKAGWFLSVLDKEFLVKRFSELAQYQATDAEQAEYDEKYAEKEVVLATETLAINPEVATRSGLKISHIKAAISNTEEYSPELQSQISETITELNIPSILQESKTLGEYKNIFRLYGVKAADNPPSPISLLKRTHKNGELPQILPLIDICNTLVCKYQISIGIYNTDNINGTIELTTSTANDRFTAIGQTEAQTIPEGSLIYKDTEKVASLHLNYRDADQTKFTAETTNITFILDGNKEHSDETLEECRQELTSLLEKYFAANITDTHLYY